MIAVLLWLIILSGLTIAVVKRLRADNERTNHKPVDPRPMLRRLTRAELNARAGALGVVGADSLRTKADVIEAIASHQEQRIAASAAASAGYEVSYESRRPTVTRTATGALVAGPIGAIIGLAWRKKTRQAIRIDQR